MAIESSEAPIESPEEGNEAIPLPGSLLAGKEVNAGDVVRIEVVTPPDEDGQWTGRYASSPQPIKSDNTMNEMAARYKQSKEGMS